MRASEVIRKYTHVLKSAHIDSPQIEAEILVLHLLNSDRNSLYRDDPIVSSLDEKKLYELVTRRLQGEPLQYILGYVDFLDMRLQVGQGVLIPRPETELLTLEVMNLIEKKFEQNNTRHGAPVQVLDLCAGSGCIALSIARTFPLLRVCATDISFTALSYARFNASSLGIKNVFFICGDLFTFLKKSTKNHDGIKFDIIVSNPPYIKRCDIKTLQREVRQWEPHIALDGGMEGTSFYKKILFQVPEFLTQGGHVFMEIGSEQADDVSTLARTCGFKDIKIKKDYGYFDRIISLCYR
jgi:release factor glutamine methyltransferase